MMMKKVKLEFLKMEFNPISTTAYCIVINMTAKKLQKEIIQKIENVDGVKFLTEHNYSISLGIAKLFDFKEIETQIRNLITN